MRLLIQVSSRPGCGAAQPAMTALNAVSTVTVKASERTGRASREATRKPSGRVRVAPTQCRVVGAVRDGEDAAGIAPQQHFGCDFGSRRVARCHGREDSRTARGYATFSKNGGERKSGRGKQKGRS